MAFGDEDLDVIFSDGGEFTDLSTFDVNGEPLEVYGIFTGATDETVLFGQVAVEASDPTFACKTADIETVRNRMTVEIGGDTYRVERKTKIGTGVSLVYLKT
jgi:hypothetical protein